MQRLDVGTYHVNIGDISQALPTFLATIATADSMVVIVDENTKRDCLPMIRNWGINCPSIEVKSGEVSKTLETCQYIWQQMIDLKLGRNTLLLNLGGGVIGDMGGFCAATYKRGIRFIQIPTTLLSQVDASVGGKLGVDFSGLKNSIGVFQNPEAVFIDPTFLQTLPEREIRSGFAEMIKHALIADADEWNSLSQLQDLQKVDWADYIYTSVGVKHQIVVEDPFEKSIRKALNFGHTIGHAVESAALENGDSLLHGEAIAIGMICEAYLSHKTLGLSEGEFYEIKSFIHSLYGHLDVNQYDSDYLLSFMKNDKKNEGAGINFSLIPSIGNCKVNCVVEESEILKALAAY